MKRKSKRILNSPSTFSLLSFDFSVFHFIKKKNQLMFFFPFLFSSSFCLCSSTPIPSSITNKVFPSSFIFGTSTSAYQVEGGWLDGNKGLSNWDSFSHTPGMINNNDTGDIANDVYHLYPQDIQLMKKYNLKHYRFSISWVRILPLGLNTKINQEGIAYYNDLINQLLDNGIEPHVTIFHADIPLALTMYPYKSNPFLDYQNFPIWFTNYAEILFNNFGDRVKHWFTFNEPWCTAVFGPINDSVSRLFFLLLTTYFISNSFLNK